MKWIALADLNAEIGATPVDQETYDRYLTDAGKSRADYPIAWRQPLVGVSASEAASFAAWLAGQDGRFYRLPTMHELAWLAEQNGSLHIWPCRSDLTPAGRRPICSYEWLDCRPDLGSASAALHCATHPSWLLSAPKRVIRAAFADAGFRYITFRLVRQPIGRTTSREQI